MHNADVNIQLEINANKQGSRLFVWTKKLTPIKDSLSTAFHYFTRATCMLVQTYYLNIDADAVWLQYIKTQSICVKQDSVPDKPAVPVSGHHYATVAPSCGNRGSQA